MVWLILSSLLVFVVLIGLAAHRVDWGGWQVNWIDGWVRLLCQYWHQQSAIQIPLPDQGPAIVVANHVSGLDAFILISASRRPLRFLIATEEYYRPGLHWLFKRAGCIPVDRKGRPEQALRQARRALEQGEVLALFPHGKIHLDSDPPRRIKAGAVRLAAWAEALVYPVRIDGVTAQGSVLLAPFIPSKITLTLSSSLDVKSLESAEALARITFAIETPAGVKAS